MVSGEKVLCTYGYVWRKGITLLSPLPKLRRKTSSHREQRKQSNGTRQLAFLPHGMRFFRTRDHKRRRSGLKSFARRVHSN